MDRTPGSGEIIPQSSPPTHIYQGTDRPSRNMAEPGWREPTGARPVAAHPASSKHPRSTGIMRTDPTPSPSLTSSDRTRCA